MRSSVNHIKTTPQNSSFFITPLPPSCTPVPIYPCPPHSLREGGRGGGGAGDIVVEALVLTAGAMVALTAFTYGAGRQGFEFSFLGPFVFVAVVVLLLWSFIQVATHLPPI